MAVAIYDIFPQKLLKMVKTLLVPTITVVYNGYTQPFCYFGHLQTFELLHHKSKCQYIWLLIKKGRLKKIYIYILKIFPNINIIF